MQKRRTRKGKNNKGIPAESILNRFVWHMYLAFTSGQLVLAGSREVGERKPDADYEAENFDQRNFIRRLYGKI